MRGVSGVVAAALLILILVPALTLVLTSLVEYGRIQRQLVELEARSQQLALELQRGVTGGITLNETAQAGVLTVSNTLARPVTVKDVVLVFEDWRASLLSRAAESGAITVAEATVTCGPKTYNVSELRNVVLGPGCTLVISFQYAEKPVSATLLASTAIPGAAQTMPGAVSVAVSLAQAAPAPTPTTPPGPSWLSGCLCRVPLYIENPSGMSLEGYPVRVELTGAMLGVDLSQLSPEEFRFTDSDGVTLLPFWFEEWKPSENRSVVWVKLSVGAGETKTIYAYYFCDSNLPGAPDPSRVFTFFDDFSTNPATSGKWRVYKRLGSEFTWDSGTKTVTLTSNSKSQGVAAFMNVDLLSDIPPELGWHLHFLMYISGTADGVAVGFYKNETPYQLYGQADNGGSLGMNAWNPSSNTWVRSEGYALEFDIYRNTREPSVPHVAIVSTYETPPEGGAHDLVGPHYGLVTGVDYRGSWWRVDVYFHNATLRVYLNGTLLLSYTNETLFSRLEEGGIAIGAGTGGETALQVIGGPVYLRPWVEDEPLLRGWGASSCTAATPPTQTTPWLEGWHYRRPLTIYNELLSDLSDYQLKIVLTTSNFTFSKAKSDGSDLRFTLDDGVTLLDYWVEYWNATEGKAVVWVKVPDLPAQQNTTIYMYYGNPSATFDPQHHGLLKIVERLPASDGPGYMIVYEDWNMGRSYFQPIGEAQRWYGDDHTWTLSLPFPFPYYDASFTRVYVCSNGFIGLTYNGRDYTSTERELRARGMIAVFWADLRTNFGGDIYVDEEYEDVYGRGVYVRWKTTFYYHSGLQQFAVVLYQSGLIRMDYDGVSGRSTTDSSVVVGVSKGDNQHYTVVYGGVGVPPSELNNHASIMFWPRKKADIEPTVIMGAEESRS